MTKQRKRQPKILQPADRAKQQQQQDNNSTSSSSRNKPKTKNIVEATSSKNKKRSRDHENDDGGDDDGMVMMDGAVTKMDVDEMHKSVEQQHRNKRLRTNEHGDSIAVNHPSNQQPTKRTRPVTKKQQKRLARVQRSAQLVKSQQMSSLRGSCRVVLKQRVNHRRTFYFLEQVLLRHEMDRKLLRENEPSSPLLSFRELPVRGNCASWELIFVSANAANSFANFVSKVLPCDVKESHENNGSSSSSSNEDKDVSLYSVDIAPVSRHDVVCLPKRLYQSMGALGPLLICTHMKNGSMYFVDPRSLKVAAIDAHHYFNVSSKKSKGEADSSSENKSEKSNTAFQPLFSAEQLVPYTVLDVENIHATSNRDSVKRSKNGKYVLARVHVCKTSEMGTSADAILDVPCHFAHELEAGDVVLGYDVRNSNLNDDTVQSYKASLFNMPDVVLVKKQYAYVDKKPSEKIWTLKSWKMAIDDGYEQFLEELEEEKEMRKEINLYKNPNQKQSSQSQGSVKDNGKQDRSGPRDKIMLEELLEMLTL